MRYTSLLFPGFWVAILLASTQIFASETDRAALIALYQATNGDNWTDNSGWKAAPTREDGFNEDPCSEPLWYGVDYCESGRVAALGLPFNGLHGILPEELGNLTGLEFLELRGNQLSGPIPPQLGNVSNLRDLDLSRNLLGGAIPSELGDLANLEELSLESNQLTGRIPAELGNLPSLRFLDLNSNLLTGPIPPELGNLSNLLRLNLFQNQLTGAITSELSKLESLTWLILMRNQLTGSIPAELGSLANLEYLFLSGNQLTGTIPPELGNLAGLRELHLAGNLLTGSIPRDLGNLKDTYLILSHNYFEGEVPSEIATHAEGKLDIRHNRLDSVEEGLDAELNRAQFGDALWNSLQNISAVYPQLAVGGGFEVVLMVSSRSSLPWTGRVYLNGGVWPEDRPWTLDGAQMEGESSFTLSLEPFATRKMVLSSSSPAGIDGWVSLCSEGDSRPEDVAAAFFYNLSNSSGLSDSTGVGPSEFGNNFFFPVERSSTGRTVLTGVALRSAYRVLLILRNEEGEVSGQVTVQEDGAELVGELFPGLPADFVGSIEAISPARFFLTVLRVEVTESSGVQLTSVPATQVP